MVPQVASDTTALVRQRVESGGDRLWRFSDFRDLPFAAVAQALSRLAKAKQLRRLSRGLYYRSRPTAFGDSLPNPAALQELAAAKAPLFPAGLAAANLLGFTTQSGKNVELATTAVSVPRSLLAEGTVVHTRRPPAWQKLQREDAALLDFLRGGGRFSELSPGDTIQRTLTILAADGCLSRLLQASPTEPPRVRAMLGALLEAARKQLESLAALRQSLNPLSRFEFGPYARLPTAAAWQAKTNGSE
jgi:hypothetical protein